MVHCMGIDFPGEYSIYDAVIPFTENSVTYIPAPFPTRQDVGIDFAFFYSDCVTPTMYGEQMVNLLAAVAMERAGGRHFRQVNYKSLNKTHFDTISIQVTDQKR